MKGAVLVTGASSGIGTATAIALGASGHPVALGARRHEKCQQIAEGIITAGGTAVALSLDVTSTASVEAFVKEATAQLGAVQAVVANAGRTGIGPIHELSAEEFTAELDVNLVGAQRLTAAALPAMLERKRGDLVFVSSEVALSPRPFAGGYTAAKWGLEGMVRAMQQELEGTGVRASLVRPGQTLTEMGMDLDMDKVTEALDAWIRFGHARHDNFLTPQHLARVIEFLVSTPPGVHIPQIDVFPEGPVK